MFRVFLLSAVLFFCCSAVPAETSQMEKYLTPDLWKAKCTEATLLHDTSIGVILGMASLAQQLLDEGASTDALAYQTLVERAQFWMYVEEESFKQIGLVCKEA